MLHYTARGHGQFPPGEEKEKEMDIGGFNLTMMEIVAVVILLIVIIWGVMRVRSMGRASSPAQTERATHEVYREEERRREQGTDGV
ncbi:hypothetical protein G7076_00710 [Sphingomonas sp. HDW15A]|uniref:hypothetical protein n=1 Tax=Sphingomonas sp. HDW15A TaxID=2714942 RepID=UPI00140867B4|nr:hypothetical protein [Sphingomonas sp. HDW15A]QIK95206.1 hypothetical protein G7076_00710 [Sphingomonas sp. HDW15A]